MSRWDRRYIAALCVVLAALAGFAGAQLSSTPNVVCICQKRPIASWAAMHGTHTKFTCTVMVPEGGLLVHADCLYVNTHEVVREFRVDRRP